MLIRTKFAGEMSADVVPECNLIFNKSRSTLPVINSTRVRR